jgi:hypothetical protein
MSIPETGLVSGEQANINKVFSDSDAFGYWITYWEM